MNTQQKVECPVCGKYWPTASIQSHANICLGITGPSLSPTKRKNDSDLVSSSQKRAKGSFSNDNKNQKNDFLPKSPSNTNESRKRSNAPLAERIRPDDFIDYVGQENAVGMKSMFRLLVESDHIPSLIFWGPPGCGKTTIVNIIANQTKSKGNYRLVKMSAVTSGVADVKEAVKVAKNELKLSKRRTILFIDEIHRFNKLQQDAFLPHVEDGTITLLGATTENPSFQVNNALLSRCRVIVLEKLSSDAVFAILRRGLEALNITEIEADGASCSQADLMTSSLGIESDALLTLAHYCDGDARVALNGLESAAGSKTGSDVITVADVKEGLQRSHIQYDRKGEEHFNCASALQKSIRGGCQDGAVYWLTRMLEGGEDPLFIARRLVVTASEDIGMADVHALPMAVAAFQSCQLIGVPECAIPLAHCATYLARAPKSPEAHLALMKARDVIRSHEGPMPGVPLHLRNASSKLTRELGYGKGYSYSSFDQTYLPQELLDKKVTFFPPKN